MDDVFDEDCEDIEVSRREWNHLQENRINEGYKQGVTAGEESKLQEGFDEGYKESVTQAYQLARMRGILCAILVKQHQNDPTASREETKQTKQLVEDISIIERDLLQQVQQPVQNLTGLPGPTLSGPCCCDDNGKSCLRFAGPGAESDKTENIKSGSFGENGTEVSVPDTKPNCGRGECCTARSRNEQSYLFNAYSEKIHKAKCEVASVLKKMGFSDAFIATL